MAQASKREHLIDFKNLAFNLCDVHLKGNFYSPQFRILTRIQWPRLILECLKNIFLQIINVSICQPHKSLTERLTVSLARYDYGLRKHTWGDTYGGVPQVLYLKLRDFLDAALIEVARSNLEPLTT
jgi:hypothetical protein